MKNKLFQRNIIKIKSKIKIKNQRDTLITNQKYYFSKRVN